jgi:DNA-binding response OmpR family regulator
MRSKTQTILVIDDDVTLHAQIIARLEKVDGYVVLTEDNGACGLKTAERTSPDIILLDWMMPGMNGLEVLKALKNKSNTSRIPIYMLTGKGMMSDVEKAFDLGVDGYFTKPIALGKLSQRVRKALRNTENNKDG